LTWRYRLVLEADQSRLGEVYRRVRRGMTAEQIAADLSRDISVSDAKMCLRQAEILVRAAWDRVYST
jgi:hypothetical protein